MTVAKFKEKYEILQDESKELHRAFKPLLRRLKTLSKKCVTLADKADVDSQLYGTGKYNECIDHSAHLAKGWDIGILFRLWDFEFILDDPNGNPGDGIDNVLYNLAHTKFNKKKEAKK